MLSRYVNQFLATLSVIFIFVMMISIAADVVLRYFANAPITGTVEFNRTILVFTIFFTLGYAQYRKQHPNVEMVLNLISPKKKAFVQILEHLSALVVVAFFTYGSVLTAYKATIEGESETGIISFPIWPGRIAIAVGLFALCMQYIVDIIDDFRSSSPS